MDLYFSEFITGLMDKLNTKTAENIFDTANDTSIFPTINNQTKWTFARLPSRIHLSDGNNVHVFDVLGNESLDEDFPLRKVKDCAFNEFKKDCNYSGTAQIHRANPGMIYLTLHDGKCNPTYTFKHVSEDNWRAIPKKKSTEAPHKVDKEAFLKGLEQKVADFGDIADSGLKGIEWLRSHGTNALMALGKNPLQTAGAGLLGGALYDIGKRTLYNTPEENEQEGTGDRLMRYIAPTALLGGTGMMTHNFTNYYKDYPTYKQ